MPVEIAYPFAIGPDGAIDSVSDPDMQVRQRVHTLLGTEPGERVMLVDYGITTRSLVFEPGDSLLTETMATATRAQMATYEPGILVRDVHPVHNADGTGVVQVAMDYVRRESASTPFQIARKTNTAVINVGGKVDEVIRG